MSPAVDAGTQILPANVSSCCTKSFPSSTIWQSWPMSKSRKSSSRYTRSKTAAQKFNLKIVRLEVRRAEICSRFRLSQRPRTGALCVHRSAHGLNRVSINTLASAARLPAIYGVRDLVVAGGLMCYGADFSRSIPPHRRLDRQNSARHETRRYPGRAADQFDFVVNLKTAKALGINVPPICSRSPTR